MKNEKPILFSGEMVRAILDGRKTMTRRVIKPQPEHDDVILRYPNPYGNAEAALPPDYPDADAGAMAGRDEWICPYGAPGTRLWVRESFALHGGVNEEGSQTIEYRADAVKDDSGERDGWWFGYRFIPGSMPWRPLIHMPRWASRITLEVTAVKVERVQDISEDDARAEGVRGNAIGPWGCEGLIEDFSELWDSINAKRGYPWASNPWVWVVSFERSGA